MLMCPYPYCKRNTGKGFTRRENLNEHVRRCHGPSEELVADGAEAQGEAATDAQEAIDQALESGQGQGMDGKADSTHINTTTTASRKRKRVSPPITISEPDSASQDVVTQQQQASAPRQIEQTVLDPALSQTSHTPDIFASMQTTSHATLKVELAHLTEQNSLLQHQRAYLTNLVQEKDKQILELKQQLALYTATSHSALPQHVPYFDSPQVQLQQQQDRQQQQQQELQEHHEQVRQLRPSIQRGEDGIPHPRLLAQFGGGIDWAESAPKSVEMHTEDSLGIETG